MKRQGGATPLLPPARKCSSLKWGAGLAALTLMVMTTQVQWVSFYTQAATLALGLCLGMVLGSLCLIAEECFYRMRYHVKVPMEVNAFLGKGLMSAALVFLMVITGGVQLRQEDWLSVALVCSVFILLKSLGILGPTPVEVSWICEQRKTDVACGLAWSFYTGYLKLVLPRLGASIEEYHAQHGSNILPQRDCWKVNILVPLSASVSNQLEDIDQRIRFYENLPETVIDRAGVRSRVYKHSVYAVYDDHKQPHYCVVEYATPLDTLHQMSHDSRVGFRGNERCQQVLLFYRTLKEILDNSPECKNRYQLILLDDDCDAQADPHFLSKEILRYAQQPRGEALNGAVFREGLPLREVDLPGNATPRRDFLSRLPTLMISNDTPQPLRNPVEDTYMYPTQWC